MIKPESIGRHRVWAVTPSERTQQQHENPVAYDCEDCVLRIEGGEHGVHYVLHDRSCPIVDWERELGLDTGGEGR